MAHHNIDEQQRSRSILYLVLAGSAVLLMAAATRYRTRQRQRQHDDECLRVDDELADSFPASDPPSHSSPTGAQVG